MSINQSIFSVLTFFEQHDKFYILGHKEPDGDCIGSQLALASFLNRKGKKTVLVSEGPFVRTEIIKYESLFTKEININEPELKNALIVLDCSNISRTGEIAGLQDSTLPIAFIDHHFSGAPLGQACYVDPCAPSVTYLIQKIIEASGEKPTKEEAEFLLFGLCTDTGFFRHLDEKSSDVFESTSKLVSCGASPKNAFNQMNGSKPFNSRKMMGEFLSNSEQFFNNKLILTSLSLEGQEKYGFASRDSDMLYQLLLSVLDVEVVVVIRQETATDCTIGFRSRESVDVSQIASSFGGGGHKLASGARTQGSIEELKAKLLKAFEPIFYQTKANV